MSDEEVKPLFKSAGSSAEFLCNINGEVSLWRVGKGVGSSMRVYTEDYNGTWLTVLENHEAYLASLLVLPHMQVHVETLLRNIDVIKLYGAMLEEPRSGVG